MPLDKGGKFHFNTQRAMAADKAGPNKHKQSGEKAEGVGDPVPGGAAKGEDMDSTQTVIHHHPDGTHTVDHHDGEKTGPHHSIHEAMQHVKAKHGEEPDEDGMDMAQELSAEPAGMSGY